jgi:DNA-binding winged helix-turn-helix (wHTH) protein/TolB-like protein/Flp pilus assembly protein TadD
MLSRAESPVYEFGDFRIEGGKRLLWQGDQQVALTPKVFDTLFYLVSNAGKTIKKDELMAAIWPDTIVEENNLNKNISALRQLLGERPGEHRFIATVPGQGYRFVAQVVERPADGSEDVLAVPSDAARPAIRVRMAKPEGFRPVNLSRLRYWLLAGVAIISLAAAIFFWRRAHAPTAGPIRSIAVLPFKPIAPESRKEAIEFAEAMELGMAETLITKLSNGDLMVSPLSAARRSAASGRDAVDVGRSLGVDAVLDGSMQMAEGRIRVTVRLIRTSDGKPLLAQTFDDEIREIFATQDEITERVATVLNAKLGKQSRKHYTENVESYQQFELGRFTALKMTPQDHLKAIDYFRKAIEKDPNYALAYAGINSSYLIYTFANDGRPSETMAEAKTAAMKAVALDDELPEAHVALGKVAMFYDWDWAKAQQHLLRGYDLNPNNTEAQLYLAHYYSNMGQHDKAIELGERARTLDPTTINRNTLAAQFLFYGGRYDDSINVLNQTIELNPNHWMARMFIARAYIEKGMFHDAIASCERAKELGASSLELTALSAWSHAKLGQTGKARAQLRELETISKARYVPPYLLALVHNSLGETDAALSQLEKGIAARDARMVFLKVDPKWNNLRNEPRFMALMKQMKFE